MPTPIDSLHRYFVWSDRMRSHFDKALAALNGPLEFGSREHIELNLYMSFWYGGLFVVIEGWKELGLHDTTIDSLLSESTNVDLLRKYRNGAFHYQKDYFDGRFMDFTNKDGTAKWVRSLHSSYSGYFLAHYKVK